MTPAALNAPSTPDAGAAAPAGEPGQRLRELLRQNRLPELLVAAQAMLEAEPGARDPLLLSAVAQRLLGRIPEALATLDRLEQQHPLFSRLYEERGRCHVDARRAGEAIASFERAVQLNHALPGSWSMLQGLYAMRGDRRRAERAAREAGLLRSLPAEVVLATGLFADGDLEPAEAVIRGFLLGHGDHIEAMRLLARIGIARKVFLDAQILLGALLERAPDYRAAREEYAYVLIELHRHEEALQQLQQLLPADPGSRSLRTLQAAALVGLGRFEEAIAIYRALLTGTPQDAEALLSIGHALKTLGRTPEAIETYRRAAQCRPDFGDAWWSLANLKTYRFTDAELAGVRAAIESSGTAPVDRYHLCFALGKALEDRGEFAQSFAQYARGNALKRAECRYRPELIDRNTREQIRICTPEFFGRRSAWGHPAPDPIFIVGLPRAGSTLLEQILASHSRVEGTQELPNVQQIVNRLRGFGPEGDDPRYPRVLESLTAEDLARLGQEYLDGTRAYRSGKPFFIDKMPNNFRHVGLIHLMLPRARIIDARREPMACCFSNFKQLFASGQEFTYSLEEIARYYRTYLELMRHWDRALPGRVLRVVHEDVVDDLEGSVRRMLDWCGLEFEPACLEFHRSARTVRTASSEQVRRAINREGLEQWRHFEPWLAPLRAALGDALEHWRDTAP